MLDSIRNVLLQNQTFLFIVLISIIIDFITGITKAIYKHNIQSEKLRKTIPKIIGYFAVIVIAVCLQIVFNIDYIVKIIITFIIVIEFISTIENISNYVTIPKFLINFLEEKKKLLDNGNSDEQKSEYYIPDIDDFTTEDNEK